MTNTGSFGEEFDKTVYLSGQDGVGWVLDKNRFCHRRALDELGVAVVPRLFGADIVYSIWWREKLLTSWPLRLSRKLLGKPQVVAHVTNELRDYENNVDRLRDHIDTWVCFNTGQECFLLRKGIDRRRIHHNPDYVDVDIFKRVEKTRRELAAILQLDHAKIENKYLIGSFQRDSLGADLSRPKWQKNPDLIVNALKNINKDRFTLVLAGPRRHYLINKCIEHDIPYLFVGDEGSLRRMEDDIRINTLPLETVNLLYNLVDLYMVTSVSEGGPRAIIEATLSETLVLSTRVGIAEDFLDEYCICSGEQDFGNKVGELLDGVVEPSDVVEKNLFKVKQMNSFSAFKERIAKILSATKTTAK